jgi:hypothetical protein
VDTKWFPFSKTVWFNGLIAYFGFTQQGVLPADITAGLRLSPADASLVMSAINIGLRFIKTHEAVGKNGKTPFVSWTLWFNVALIGLGIYSIVKMPVSPIAIGLIIYGVVNIILRFRTDKGLRLAPWQSR